MALAVDIELMALMASRICHDLISPIGAIANGIEILAEESGPKGDPEMRAQALDLIGQSAEQAGRRLSFCRIAFGAAGGADAKLDLNEVKRAVSDLLDGGKVRLDWQIGPGSVPRDVAKVLAVLASLTADCLARGGTLSVNATFAGHYRLIVDGEAERRSVNPLLEEALGGTLGLERVDAKLAPAVYAGLLVRAAGGQIKMADSDGHIRLEASLGLGA
jgi:histidine phosphotransferase ChpT